MGTRSVPPIYYYTILAHQLRGLDLAETECDKIFINAVLKGDVFNLRLIIFRFF